MSAVASPVTMRRAASPEEEARGHFYALFARLFGAPPDAQLLAALGRADPLPADGDRALAAAWAQLVAASSVMDAEAAAEEYEALFVGIGKADVSIYAGHYAGAPAIDHPRVRLQADLAALGLARREHVTEPEDHMAGILEAMRVLAAGGAGRAPAAIAEQRRFFDTHLKSAAPAFLDAVGRSPKANYYRVVAACAAAFVSLESDLFQLD